MDTSWTHRGHKEPNEPGKLADEAHWLFNGHPHDHDWVTGAPAGTWTMSFPEGHYPWRNRVSSLCIVDENQRLRLYPPYAIAVDVDRD